MMWSKVSDDSACQALLSGAKTVHGPERSQSHFTVTAVCFCYLWIPSLVRTSIKLLRSNRAKKVEVPRFWRVDITLSRLSSADIFAHAVAKLSMFTNSSTGTLLFWASKEMKIDSADCGTFDYNVLGIHMRDKQLTSFGQESKLK